MNKDQFSGDWKMLKGKVKESFGKLTDDDLTRINGKREQLIGALQKRYGDSKEKAEENVKKFEKLLKDEDKVSEDEDAFFTKKTGTEDL